MNEQMIEQTSECMIRVTGRQVMVREEEVRPRARDFCSGLASRWPCSGRAVSLGAAPLHLCPQPQPRLPHGFILVRPMSMVPWCLLQPSLAKLLVLAPVRGASVLGRAPKAGLEPQSWAY